jgi:hypothetical protein
LKRQLGVVIGGLAAILWAAGSSSAQETEDGCTSDMVGSPGPMPARFVSGRIYLDLATRSGDTLTFYTDTGGGTFLYGHAVDRIEWQDSTGVLLGDVAADCTFPDPLGTEDRKLPVFRPEEKARRDFDGMLGQAWFADRIWAFDYESEVLLLHDTLPDPAPEERVVQLGFRTDSTGIRVLSFPRVDMVVDGDTLQMLFDTGAMITVTTGARAALGNEGPSTRAASFITTEVMDRWRSRHPDWRLILEADENVTGELTYRGSPNTRPAMAYSARFTTAPLSGPLIRPVPSRYRRPSGQDQEESGVCPSAATTSPSITEVRAPCHTKIRGFDS